MRRHRTLSAAHRRNISLSLRGHSISPDTRRRISEALKGRRCRWLLKPVRCIETGREWRSMADAAREMGVSSNSISQAVARGWRCKGNHFELIQQGGLFDGPESGDEAIGSGEREAQATSDGEETERRDPGEDVGSGEVEAPCLGSDPGEARGPRKGKKGERRDPGEDVAVCESSARDHGPDEGRDQGPKAARKAKGPGGKSGPGRAGKGRKGSGAAPKGRGKGRKANP